MILEVLSRCDFIQGVTPPTPDWTVDPEEVEDGHLGPQEGVELSQVRTHTCLLTLLYRSLHGAWYCDAARNQQGLGWKRPTQTMLGLPVIQNKVLLVPGCHCRFNGLAGIQ